MYYVQYLYLRCVFYHIYILSCIVYIFTHIYIYMYYVFLPMTSRFPISEIGPTNLHGSQADTPHPQRCDALCLADVTRL